MSIFKHGFYLSWRIIFRARFVLFRSSPKPPNCLARCNFRKVPLSESSGLHLLPPFRITGADPLIPDGDQRVAFHMAAAGGQVSAVKLLRSMTQAVPGAHSARDRDGHTPLHAAAERGHVKVVRQLLRWRCSIETESQHQSRPLHLAARHGHGPVISFLLEKQANHAVKDETGAEPLHLAVISGCKSAVEILLQSGAQVHSRNHEGNQPIHIAADSGQASIAMLLLSARSDVSAIGAQGQPWMMAQAQQDVKLSVALKPHQEL